MSRSAATIASRNRALKRGAVMVRINAMIPPEQAKLWTDCLARHGSPKRALLALLECERERLAAPTVAAELRALADQLAA